VPFKDLFYEVDPVMIENCHINILNSGCSNKPFQQGKKPIGTTSAGFSDVIQHSITGLYISRYLMQGNTEAEHGCIFQGDSCVQIVIIEVELSEIAANT
jgi:hypothetical protein